LLVVTEDNITARGYGKTVQDIANELEQPKLLEYIRRFLYDQLHPDADVCGMDAPLDRCPDVHGSLQMKVFHSAVSTHFAPSDLSGLGGMRRERIRATPSWKRGPGRYDCIFVDKDPSLDGFQGLHVARVVLFLSFRFQGIIYSCAQVQWFSSYGDSPCEDTGMWRVLPDYDAGGRRMTSIINIDSILRAAHLIGVAGSDFLPRGFTFSDSLSSFRLFYVNKYADHHAHEIAF
jgi:hypothetical protein